MNPPCSNCNDEGCEECLDNYNDFEIYLEMITRAVLEKKFLNPTLQ